MSEPVDLGKFRKAKLTQKAKGKTLCGSGFHKWKIVTEKKFDTRQGKLVTEYCCERCGEKKVKAL